MHFNKTIILKDSKSQSVATIRHLQKKIFLQKHLRNIRLKIIGEWADLGSNRVFRLFDVTDPEVILAASFPWNDLGNVELVPVMETEEVLKLLPKSVAGIVVEV